MIAAAAALAIAATPPTARVGGRIAASAAAAQAWQGPLDGAWTLYGARGRAILSLQITDPAGGGPLEGAWRAAGRGGAAGFVEAITRRGDRLTIRILGDGAAAGPDTVVTLRRRGAGLWSGWVAVGGARRPATLRAGAPR